MKDINIENILSKINITDDCWIWKGNINRNGYGVFSHYVDGKQKHINAHRISYSIHKGDLIDGMVIDHICRNRSCVNPDHLRQVTKQINAIENSISKPSINSIKTHCIHGHEFNKSNTYIYIRRGHPQRKCRECHRIKERNKSR